MPNCFRPRSPDKGDSVNCALQKVAAGEFVGTLAKTVVLTVFQDTPNTPTIENTISVS